MYSGHVSPQFEPELELDVADSAGVGGGRGLHGGEAGGYWWWWGGEGGGIMAQDYENTWGGGEGEEVMVKRESCTSLLKCLILSTAGVTRCK